MEIEELKALCETIRNLDASLDEYRIIRNALEDSYIQEKIQLAMHYVEPDPITLECPVCEQKTDVYHLQWEAITCQTCQNMVQRSRWKLWQDSNDELPF